MAGSLVCLMSWWVWALGLHRQVGLSSFRTPSSGFPLLSAEASEIMKSIGEAIQYLHSINIAHRDVKVTPA